MYTGIISFLAKAKIVTLRRITSAILLLLASTTVWGQAGTGDHSLDGISIDWTYNNSEARMVVSYAAGLGEHEWIAGARKGNSDSEIPYSVAK